MVMSQFSMDAPWSFFCGEVQWRGYVVHPLRDAVALWIEGTAMGSCLFHLRQLCSLPEPSRFFSVTRQGKRVATLELCWSPPMSGFRGMQREVGRWSLRDVRLSYNRVPDARLVDAMWAFSHMYDEWSHRPSRWPAGRPEAVRSLVRRLRLGPAAARVS